MFDCSFRTALFVGPHAMYRGGPLQTCQIYLTRETCCVYGGEVWGTDVHPLMSNLGIYQHGERVMKTEHSHSYIDYCLWHKGDVRYISKSCIYNVCYMYLQTSEIELEIKSNLCILSIYTALLLL